MTTKAKGITLPVWDKIRLTLSYFEVSSSSAFTSNDSYKYTSAGISPISTTAPVAAAPAALTLQAQNAQSGFAAVGADVKLTPGVGSVSNVSGNAVIKDTAGNGSAWNNAHLVMGSYHFWVDPGTGKLRMKSSAPTSATDGNIVNF